MALAKLSATLNMDPASWLVHANNAATTDAERAAVRDVWRAYGEVLDATSTTVLELAAWSAEPGKRSAVITMQGRTAKRVRTVVGEPTWLLVRELYGRSQAGTARQRQSARVANSSDMLGALTQPDAPRRRRSRHRGSAAA
jgi:hypothetical protein